jgi:asparagine synthase (glutamine-hydrolysing)
VCGIAGFSGRFDPSALTAMNAVIAHRGPDDSGIYSSPVDGIGLAHRRLSIIDLSPLGHQPMWDVGGQVAIVFNGEIYNYRELRAELVAQGHVFRSESDTEVLLNLYLRDAERLLDSINGIFSFAIWDTRTRTLFVARDHLGVKPLYFAETAHGFAFASELKALLVLPGISRELDPQAVFYHLTYVWSPSPHTLLQGVRKLEPGHALTVAAGRIVRHWRYYELPYSQPVDAMDERSAILAVRDAVSTAVARQMVSDVPVGAFLSGGLDSSAVVAFAREHAGAEALQCFTIGFDDDAFTHEGMAEDLPYAQRVAAHLGVDLHTVRLGPEMAGRLEEMIYHLDEPQGDAAPLNVWFISELARARGIKVLLSGAGGDDIFSGYRRHYALQLERYWRFLPQAFRCGIGALSEALPSSVPAARRLAKAMQYAGLDERERLCSYFYWQRPAEVMRLLHPDVQQSLAAFRPAGFMLDALAALPPDTADMNRMLYLESRYFLADHNLNYTDKMSMAAGVEVRVPLLDLDLVALAARLPVDFKQRGSTGKWIFKKAMEPYLPHDVIYRPKTGFGAPVRRWLKHELRHLVDDTLSAEALARRRLFDPAAVRRLIDLDRSGRIDASYTVFSLLCIELWCRRFLDSAPARERVAVNVG